MNILCFKVGDIITRTEPSKGVGDRSFIGDAITLVANPQRNYACVSNFTVTHLSIGHGIVTSNLSYSDWGEGLTYYTPDGGGLNKILKDICTRIHSELFSNCKCCCNCQCSCKKESWIGSTVKMTEEHHKFCGADYNTYKVVNENSGNLVQLDCHRVGASGWINKYWLKIVCKANCCSCCHCNCCKCC